MPGQAAKRADISAITNASPCEITTSAAHGFSSLDVVRLTDLNGNGPSQSVKLGNCGYGFDYIYP